MLMERDHGVCKPWSLYTRVPNPALVSGGLTNGASIVISGIGEAETWFPSPQHSS